MLLRIALSTVLAMCGCHKPEATVKEEPTLPRVAAPLEVAAAARFDSPSVVYKRYAETLSTAQWAEAIALFTRAGQVALVVSNFKGLALLPGSPHPKKLEYKGVLREFCQSHGLRCADEKWNEVFAPTLLAGASVTAMISDLTSLAKAQPEATYIEIMRLVYGVDQSSIIPLDPTLSDVTYTDNKASGIARRADGQTTTMTFENTPERGWMIVE
jgi:hypothetical protein